MLEQKSNNCDNLALCL